MALGAVKQLQVQKDDRGHGLVRLGTVALQGMGVFSRCHRCGHEACLDSRLLAAQWGPALPIAEVGARLACAGCGSKDVATRPDWPAVASAARDEPARPPAALAAAE